MINISKQNINIQYRKNYIFFSIFKTKWIWIYKFKNEKIHDINELYELVSYVMKNQ